MFWTTPNVLSVGVLIEQGYTFYWTPNSTKVEHRVGHCSLTHTILPSSSTGLYKSNYQENSSNPLPSKCFLITPDGVRISLRISNRVPYFHDGVNGKSEGSGGRCHRPLGSSDEINCPDEKTSAARGSLARALSPKEMPPPVNSAAFGESGSKLEIMPAYRIRSKSKLDLTPEQKSKLEIAMQQIKENSISAKTAATHDLLHFKSNCSCDICRAVKQRRNYSHPVPIVKRHLATKLHEKTDIDHYIYWAKIRLCMVFMGRLLIW